MTKLMQNLDLDEEKWAMNVHPLEYRITKEYSTLIRFSSDDLILFRSAVCCAQKLGIFLAEDNLVAFELCDKLQKWQEEDSEDNGKQATLSDKELVIIDVSLSYVSLQMAVQGNRLNIVLNSSQRVEV